MHKLMFLALPCLAIVAGCTPDQSPSAAVGMSPMEKVYVRIDGKRLSDHPELMAKLDADRAICRGRSQEVGLVAKNEFESKNLGVQLLNAGIKESKISDVMQGCMAERGYVYLTVAEAETRADALATKSKHKKKIRTAMNDQ